MIESFVENTGGRKVIVLSGPSGSGKSTILKLALGLYRPQAGSVILDGRDIRQIDPVLALQGMTYHLGHRERA